MYDPRAALRVRLRIIVGAWLACKSFSLLDLIYPEGNTCITDRCILIATARLDNTYG